MMPDVGKMKRVAVVGTSCSGKTTLARRLAEKRGVRHIELDALFWKPNWTPPPPDEFRDRVANAVAAEEWVLDGNYSVVRDILWTRATTLVWLNYPFRVVGWRALRRTTRNVVYRNAMWASENVETFRHAFLSRDSILWWVATTYRRRRREYPLLFQKPEHAHLQIIELESPVAAERFLENFD